MNVRKACEILEINMVEPDWEEKIKKKYYEKALQYHPDKNKDPDSEEMFKEVNEAYEYLLKNDKNYEKEVAPSFEILVQLFTNSLDEHSRNMLLHQWLDKILHVCEYQAKHIIDNLDYYKFTKLYNILIKYRSIFHLSDDFYDFMEKKNVFWFSQGQLKKRQMKDINYKDYIYDEDALESWKTYEKMEDGEWELQYYVEIEKKKDLSSNETIMIIRPTLDDVYIDNVYKCQHDNRDYLIPLWHHELVYDCNTYDFIVKVLPKMPSPNYWIDDENNLHQEVEYTLYELWDYVTEEKCMEIFFGKKRFVFYPYKLNLLPEQTWVWENEGISKINNNNVYDVSKRAKVILHIKISGVM